MTLLSYLAFLENILKRLASEKISIESKYRFIVFERVLFRLDKVFRLR